LCDFNRVALVEQNLVQQQDLLAQSRGEISLGLIDVYKALGGGWQIRCAPASVTAGLPGGGPAAATPDIGEVLPQPRPEPIPPAK